MPFASIYIPNFLVQAVMRAEPDLRNHAVALVDGRPPLWSVVAANEAAFQSGIVLGITKSQAEQFGAVQIRHRSQAQEKTAHAALLDLGWSVSPRVEDTAPDLIAVDIAGLSSLFGSEDKIAQDLARRATLLGLIAQIAVSSNLEVAIHAARGLSGVTLIPSGEERQCIGRLPVRVLLPSADILETFERWGVCTCKTLAALPVLQLSERLGQEGVRLHELARGASERSLMLAERSVYFEEEMELDDAVEDLESLAFLLGRLLDQLCERLAARSLAACVIRLRFDLEPSFEKDFQLANDSSRRTITKIYKKVLTLPVPMRDSKMLLKLLRLQLQADPPIAAILKIVLAADPSRPRVAQGGLFLPPSPDPEKLELTIARLSHLVGGSNVGSPELTDTHRPGEFRMNKFIPLHEEPAISRERITKPGKIDDDTLLASKPITALRTFRPPLPAMVELREGHPIRIAFHGVRGDVVATSGPWRTSGDWWQEESWQHDEWDLEIQFHSVAVLRMQIANHDSSSPHGLYRIFYDSIGRSWFVRGMYD
ncbi:MAG: DNA polymerase Y family protein [Candidatus Acidiferrales bacterium]